jgi:hypothetical protein
MCAHTRAREAPAPCPTTATSFAYQVGDVNGLYLSFDTDSRPERIHDAFPAATLERLRAIKAVYGPEDVFEPSLPLQAAPSQHAAA